MSDDDSRFRRAAGLAGKLAAAGAAVSGLLEWGEDGRLSKVKIGPLAIFDRRRMEARRAARRARRDAGK